MELARIQGFLRWYVLGLVFHTILMLDMSLGIGWGQGMGAQFSAWEVSSSHWKDPDLTLLYQLISCMVRRILRFFPSLLQTLSSMLAMIVLEHPPFPSASLQTPAHAITLCFTLCWMWCCSWWVKSIEASKWFDLCLAETWCWNSSLVLHHGETLYPNGFVFPCPQSRIITLRCTNYMYLSKQGFASQGCSENTWFFHCNLEGEACVHILAWGTSQLLSRTCTSGFFTIPTLSARRKLSSSFSKDGHNKLG